MIVTLFLPTGNVDAHLLGIFLECALDILGKLKPLVLTRDTLLMKALLKAILPTSIRRKLSRGAQKHRKVRYYWLAKKQIEVIKRLPDSPFKKVVRAGFMRGIDF